MNTPTEHPEEISEPAGYTIPGFCRRWGIGRTKYYDMKRRGLGPVEMDLDGTIRISRQADDEWRQARERRNSQS